LIDIEERLGWAIDASSLNQVARGIESIDVSRLFDLPPVRRLINVCAVFTGPATALALSRFHASDLRLFGRFISRYRRYGIEQPVLDIDDSSSGLNIIIISAASLPFPFFGHRISRVVYIASERHGTRASSRGSRHRKRT